jgi:UDP-GlcNAc:undecaprenyl-phosphate GlcNAc-1-phosphate transferase
MSFAGAAVTGSVAAMLVAATVSGVIAWSGPVDRPRDRGAHKAPTPTAGGLGVIAGTSIGLLLFALRAPHPPAGLGKIAAALGFSAVLGLIGALDDLLDLGARTKLLLQVGLSLLFAVFVGHIEAIPLTETVNVPLGPFIGVLGTALWLVVVTNAVNFMDGANGLAAGALAIVLAVFGRAALAGGDGLLGVAATMAAIAGLGFLPWNFPRAKLFQGDAGALFTSFFAAALAVIGAGAGGHGAVFIFFIPLALLPFLADVLLTLLSRARARKRLLDAHAEHLYQRWLAAGGKSHVALAWRVYGLTAVFSGAALLLTGAAPLIQLAGFIIGTSVAVVLWVAVRRRLP